MQSVVVASWFEVVVLLEGRRLGRELAHLLLGAAVACACHLPINFTSEVLPNQGAQLRGRMATGSVDVFQRPVRTNRQVAGSPTSSPAASERLVKVVDTMETASIPDASIPIPVADAAEIRKVNAGILVAAAKKGFLPCYRFGRDEISVTLHDVEEYIASRYVPKTAEPPKFGRGPWTEEERAARRQKLEEKKAAKAQAEAVASVDEASRNAQQSETEPETVTERPSGESES